jgi:hypothetical protein
VPSASFVVGMRVCVVTLEYDVECFSGNGILSQALVRGLSTASSSSSSSSGVRVLVVCGKPSGDEVQTSSLSSMHATRGVVDVVYVTVPRDKWFKLTLDGAWKEFADGCAREDVRQSVRQFAPRVTLGVDWSSHAAVQSIGMPIPYVMTAFRIFSQNDERHLACERDAVQMAAGVVALCGSDARYICERLGASREPEVISPPLRSTIVNLAKEVAGSVEYDTGTRRYLSCVVRVSVEKEPDRFVCLVEELARRGVFASGSLVPLLCANENILRTSKYAQDLKERFLSCVPNGRVIENFLDERELSAIFRETALNVHPSTADAFGMTVVEAAAFGAPSVMHRGGAVGASELLRPHLSESIEVDVLAPVHEFADKIESVIADPKTRLVVAKNASARALEWDETSYGQAMLEHLSTY